MSCKGGQRSQLHRSHTLHVMSGVPLRVEYRTTAGISAPSGQGGANAMFDMT